LSDKPQQKPRATREVPPDVAEKLFLGEITPGEFLGMSNESLYKLATVGHEMLKTGQLQAALDIFEGLVAASPYDSVFHCHLAATYARFERLEEAKKSYSQALNFNIANVDAMVGRAEIYLRQNNIPEALKDLQAALKADPQAQRESTKRARTMLLMLQKMAQEKTGTTVK
jgi:tetratricopeptide (TPR) repeat protein